MPEAALAIPAAPIHLEVVPSAASLPDPRAVQHHEALEFLQELATEAISRHDVLKREASGKILDVCENLVRCGWYLSDARQFLIEDGQYTAWVEQTFPMISYGYACRLRKLANHFCRDAIDADQRKRLDIRIEGLLEIGDHLRRQIAATQAASISDLYRFAGLLPPPGARVQADGRKGAHPRGLKATLNDLKGHVRSLEDLEEALSVTASALVQVDPATLTLEECTQLLNALLPYAEFHRTLLCRIL